MFIRKMTVLYPAGYNYFYFEYPSGIRKWIPEGWSDYILKDICH